MAWKKKLWGVFFTGSIPGDKPVLLSTGWMNPRPQSQYEGEPTRAILFMTREQAREWCRKKRATYAGCGDHCKQWKFTPVRVIETVAVMSNAALTGAEGVRVEGTVMQQQGDQNGN